jgi:hypothetical protein
MIVATRGGHNEESPQLDMHSNQIPTTFCNHKIVQNMHHLLFVLGILVCASWERKQCSSTHTIAKFTRAQDQINGGGVVIKTIIIRSSKHTHTHTHTHTHMRGTCACVFVERVEEKKRHDNLAFFWFMMVY